MLAAGFLVSSGVQFYFFTEREGTQFSLDPAQRALLTGVWSWAPSTRSTSSTGWTGSLQAWSASARLRSSSSATSWPTSTRSPWPRPAPSSAPHLREVRGVPAHNFHPARLFMGDSGSMLIGFVLSASALTLTTQFAGTRSARARPAPGEPAPDPAPGPPADLDPDRADGRPPARRGPPHPRRPLAVRPDKQHLHHRLLEIGHSQRRAVFIMWLWAALVAFGTVLASLYTGPWCGPRSRRCRGDRRADLRPAQPPPPPRASTESRLRVGLGPRFQAPPDFVLVFTSTQTTHDRTAADHDDRTRRPPPGAPVRRAGPRVRVPALW